MVSTISHPQQDVMFQLTSQNSYVTQCLPFTFFFRGFLLCKSALSMLRLLGFGSGDSEINGKIVLLGVPVTVLKPSCLHEMPAAILVWGILHFPFPFLLSLPEFRETDTTHLQSCRKVPVVALFLVAIPAKGC